MIRQISGLSLVALLIVFAERPAFAYIDPGTGSLLWQSIAAVLAGLAFSFKRIVVWVKNRK